MITLCLNFIFLALLAQSPLEPQWLDWKEKAFEKELTSKTSFLNAISLEQALSGQKLYLNYNNRDKSALWSKKSTKVDYASAEHLGDKIRIIIQDKTLGYLTHDPKNRRRHFDLPNGLIAEVVFGKRANKLWTYIYDPEQIKKFTGFRFYPFNEKAIIKAVLTKTQAKKIGYKTVQGDQTEVFKVGNLSFVINGIESHLTAYSWQIPEDGIKSISLIFVDDTAGLETYGGGRELSVDLNQSLKDTQTVEIDFNKTINFYCAHSPFWHCPVGLQEPIKTKIMAGEMLPLKKIISL
jgi:uncharacterized protein (DUF1684 family)